MYGDMGSAAGLVGVAGDLPKDGDVRGLVEQGVAHVFGFNLVEALRNFETAAALAPECALCHWGVAASFAPNINYYVENQTRLNAAATRALELADAQRGSLSDKTQHLIRAFAKLVAPADNQDAPDSPFRKAWSDALCGGTINLAGDDATDPDVDAFCASSLMALSPWNYYQGFSSWPDNVPMKPFLLQAKSRLLGAVHRGVGGGPHVFAIHLLIHLLEPSNAPESYRWEALAPTELLFGGSGGELVPAQGHLTHMPAHLFLRTGKYNEAVATSTVSTDDDNARYASKCLNPYGHGHNLKMYVANARLAGRLGDAVAHARKAILPDAGEEPTPNGGKTCVDCAGTGSPEVVLTLARFGQWHAVLEEPVPSSWGLPDWAGYNEAAFRYARAAAYWALSGAGVNKTLVALGDAEAALCEKASPRAAAAAQAFNYSVILPEQLHAARAMHGGKRDFAAAISHLRNVQAADDANMYLEPPRVWYPPRECLGALLLAAPQGSGAGGDGGGGNATEALRVFEEDLAQFVESPWSLFGAAEAAKTLGMGDLAKNYSERGEAAWRKADGRFVSPCPELLLTGA